MIVNSTGPARSQLVAILKRLFDHRCDDHITVLSDDPLLVIMANWPPSYWACYPEKRHEVKYYDLLEAIILESEKRGITVTWKMPTVMFDLREYR